MNAVKMICDQIKDRPHAVALWLPDHGSTTFGELAEIATGIRQELLRLRIGPGDTVLLFDLLGPRLYASIIAIASLGAATALIEPWMPISNINHILPFVNPKVFLTNTLGKVWGARVQRIRAIPHWVSTSQHKAHTTKLSVVDVAGDAPAIVTFTSGTTGNPKGMVRTHQYLIDQHHILHYSLHGSHAEGGDVCIFANFALSNLSAGRPSLIIPPRWKASHLGQLDHLKGDLTPTSMTCGPAFLLETMKHSRLSTLQTIHVGGALTDCGIFERSFAKWRETSIHQLYGSTEVEPVAVIDARNAVSMSRAAGHFQTLCIGNPVSAIKAQLTSDTIWVSGPHVCPRYLANDEENAAYKRRDPDGTLWHRMGDRIIEKDYQWWFSGREKQTLEAFLLEQQVYSVVGSSAGFLEFDCGRYTAYFQNAEQRRDLILKTFPQISTVADITIKRDRRHRARIDRKKSMK